MQRRPVLYHSGWPSLVLWPWPCVHLGELAPTTLPQCRLVSNPRSAGLFLSGLSLRGLLSLILSMSRPLSLFVSRPFSLSLPSPSRGGFPPRHPPHPFSLSLCPQCLCLILHHLVCWLPSGISPFAWRCAQHGVEEPNSVSGYRVSLPEKRLLEQPYEISSARHPHMQAISTLTHRGRHRSVALFRWTVDDCLPLERGGVTPPPPFLSSSRSMSATSCLPCKNWRGHFHLGGRGLKMGGCTLSTTA